MLNLNLRGLLALTMAGAISLAGCKKEEAKPAEGPDASAAAPAAPAAPAAGSDNLNKAKAMVDKMADALNKMVADVEAAGTDTAKIKEIGEAFKKNGEAMKSEGEALQKVLTDDEKKTLEGYGREKIGPLMGKLMAAMMKAQAASAPAAPTPTEGGAAPAGAAPTGAAPAAAAPAPAAPAAK